MNVLKLLLLSLAAVTISVAPPCGASEPALKPTRVNSLGMEFVRIPAGTFFMGSRPQEPHRDLSEIRHPVRITHDYYLQTTEVTLGQWRALMGRKMFFGRRGEDNLPVSRVSWYDAQEFIERLNAMGMGRYRLPTEAEWEYACRAGTDSAYAWGETIDCSRALYANNPDKYDLCMKASQARGLPGRGPAQVKSFAPNAWGLYDMHGNVWEWCQDWFGDYDPAQRDDPSGSATGDMRVRRGGSWFGGGEACRSANRANGHPASRYSTTGFRLVLEVEK